jgi:hypothetical protein
MLTREDDVDAHALHRRGWTISAIARHLGHDRKTICAYLTGGRVAGQRLWVPETGRTLCDLLILVEQSAESVAPADVVNLGWCVAGECSQGSGLAEGAVRPVIVVVELVLAKGGRGVALVDDQDAVEELAADGADEAFGNGVGPRCPHRRLDDGDVDGCEDGVEGRGELAVAIADEEPESPAGVVESMVRLRASWVSHAPVGCAVTPRMWTRRVVCSIAKNA